MRRSILIRLATPDPARLWTGIGNLAVPSDIVETEDGAIYLGAGDLISGFTEIEQLINGVADRLEMVVSGVTPQIMALAQEEAAGVKGAALDIGTVLFDAGWQVDTVRWRARYRADKLSIDRQPGTRTITLSLGSDDTGRSRAPNAFWTAADQRRRPGSEDDAMFDHVSGLNAGTARIFSPK